MAGATLRILTWNLYHGRDGLPGLGETLSSTLLRRPVDDGAYVHLNRKLTGIMAERVRAWAPDLCALQEVPTAAVREIVARTGMLALGATTGPLIGPRRLRDALAACNPDLWRSHEGNANLLLVGRALAPVAGSARAVRLNPPGAILRATVELGLEAGELLRYLPEPRVAVIARLRAPSGAELAAACLHCHNARHPGLIAMELARATEALEGAARGAPAILAGDLNAPPSHPALAAAAAAGWSSAPPAPGVGIDRILTRRLEVVEPERALPAGEREVAVTFAGRARRVRLSDHDPVVATVRVSGSPAAGPAGR
ncbi:MAG TPA: endonuclease/exonuclease/phosphatase family protein [Miltoncostaeaceae bacterium]|nr:endonuclease/exonuclease/phosphatase family protein [Miltoncostaeaceae bacterium]